MKKFLISIVVGFFGLISFGYCDTVSSLLNPVQDGTFTIHYGVNTLRTITSDEYGIYCLYVNSYHSTSPAYTYFKFGFRYDATNITDPGAYLYIYDLTLYGGENPTATVCMQVNQPYILLESNFTADIDIGYELYRLDVLLNTPLPQMTSSECQSEYSLMPIDSCDSEYCEMNDLCSVIGGSGSSTLYINDVRHESAPFIYVNIPEEFKRDYLTGVNEFTINVEGLNGDQDYINGIIDVNSFRPSSEDFTQTFVGGLTLIFPYIIITAVILFIRRFIRKIFK